MLRPNTAGKTDALIPSAQLGLPPAVKPTFNRNPCNLRILFQIVAPRRLLRGLPGARCRFRFDRGNKVKEKMTHTRSSGEYSKHL